MRLSLAEVARLVGGELLGGDTWFESLHIDSREVRSGELFCAVMGDRVDGHEYVAKALENGAVGALVAREIENVQPLIKVNSVVGAMAAIALHCRRMLNGPVLGVTGSAGKTTVKEMVAAALSPLGDVLKSEGNLNTEYGVPMTWSRLESRHKSAVIEMAMRGPGQVAHLARMSAPDIGVVTSIGSAHIGELGSRDAIAAAKAELLEALPAGGTAVIPADSDYTDFLRGAASCKVVTVGATGDYRVLETRPSGDMVEFALATPQGEFAGMVPGIGDIQAKNAAMAVAAADAAGVPTKQAVAALKSAQFPDKRMQVINRNGVTIWLDAYNSSPESCKLALQSFAVGVVPGRRFAILGDMLELGRFAEEQHRAVGAVAAVSDLTELALVGQLAPWIGDGARDAGYQGEVSYYADAIAARQVLERTKAGDAVLIKASRGLALERVLEDSYA